MIREDYLHQNAFHEIDTYSSTNKQFKMLDLILRYYKEAVRGVEGGVEFNKLAALPVGEEIGRFKYLTEDKVDDSYTDIVNKMESTVSDLIKEAGDAE